MTADFPHLFFQSFFTDRAHLRGGGDKSDQTKKNKDDRQVHAQNLNSALDAARENYRANHKLRAELKLAKMPTGVPLLLKVDTESFDPEMLKKEAWGLEVVCEFEDSYVIVVSPDADLEHLYDQIKRFAEEKRGGATVAELHEIITEEDHRSRLHRIVSPELLSVWDTIESHSSITVEISIECGGSWRVPEKPARRKGQPERSYDQALLRFEEKRREFWLQVEEERMQREQEIENLIADYQGRVLDNFDRQPLEEVDFSDSFTVVATIPGAAIKDIAINYPYVFEITAKESLFVLEKGDETQGMGTAAEIMAPSPDSPSVVVIDSGIQEGHPMLRQAIRQDLSTNFIDDSGEIGDDFPGVGGHGTRVAGALLFPEGYQNVQGYQLPCRIANARVLDQNGKIPDAILPARLLERIVDFYLKADPSIKIFNHSINAITAARRRFMSVWAAKIDDLCYDHDIVFIQSAGNVPIKSHLSIAPGIKQHLESGKQYPSYLREQSGKIANPGQAFSALTVGSICGATVSSEDYTSIGELDGPSPFSRTGPAIWNLIKPDVVEYGGNLVRSTDPLLLTVTTPPGCALELPRRSDEGIIIDRSRVGTSFTAPKVARLASLIQAAMPDASALLMRGLIAQSSRWAQWQGDGIGDFERFGHLGYGLPNSERATQNSSSRITFISSNSRTAIHEGEIHFYEIPIPEEILIPGAEYDILIEVTLSYVGKPRRTRKDPRKYLATWADWVSSNKGESFESFENRAKKDGDKQQTRQQGSIPWILGQQDKQGQTKGLKRNIGTLQKDWAMVKSYELGESFSIGVRGRKGWDTTLRYPAYYVLVVSLEVTNAEIELYSLVRSEVEARSRVRIAYGL